MSIKRPYGVGLLVIGVDRTGAHLFETSPNGTHKEFIAHAIGARSQSARTYLEKVYKELDDASDDDLIKHAIKVCVCVCVCVCVMSHHCFCPGCARRSHGF